MNDQTRDRSDHQETSHRFACDALDGLEAALSKLLFLLQPEFGDMRAKGGRKGKAGFSPLFYSALKEQVNTGGRRGQILKLYIQKVQDGQS